MKLEKMNWPELDYAQGKATYETVHLWTQIAGKIKLECMPWINHSWHTALLLNTTGLTTGNLPFGNKHFQINFNFLQHQLELVTSKGESVTIGFKNLTVAGLYFQLFKALNIFGIDVKINTTPNELVDPKPLDKDVSHGTYHPEHASKLHQALLNSNDVFNKFRAEFVGKCSPSHFFWGSFDLAVTRFSGRTAPKHPGGVPNLPDWVAQEAYSHEVSSSGFWPGNEMVPFAAFYNYSYPEPKGFKEASIKPKASFYKPEMGEYLLAYNDVQQAGDPEGMLLEFLHSTYNAAADLANWDRRALEK